MQTPAPEVKLPPIGIALDGDLGNRIDAVLALGMLNGLTAKGEARRISLSVSRPNLKGAQLADVISSFYAGRPAGSSNGAGLVREGMIGMPEGTTSPDDQAPLAATISRKAGDGTLVYASTITGLVDTPENSILIRNLILAQNDQNAAIVLAGPATGLVRILGLYRAVPQIVSKVRQLVVALGSFPEGPVDPSVKSDVAAARKLFAEWPTPLVAVGVEVGDALRYPGSSIETGFGWSPAHPVADAYRVFNPMPYDASAPALAAVLYAAHPTDGYFKLSDPGTISVLDDGRTHFTPGAAGRHRYLIADPAQKDRVIKLYADLVCAPPAPRPVRGRPAVVAPPPPPPAATPIKPPAP
jgi:hypothetical protein